MSIQFSDQRSIYLQIADHIMENILSGSLPPDTRLPSVRDMASEIAVNPNTIQRAYTYLQDKQIIANKRGIGYFVEADAFIKTRFRKREQFIKEELPRFFRKMELLGYSVSEIESFYNQKNAQI